MEALRVDSVALDEVVARVYELARLALRGNKPPPSIVDVIQGTLGGDALGWAPEPRLLYSHETTSWRIEVPRNLEDTELAWTLSLLFSTWLAGQLPMHLATRQLAAAILFPTPCVEYFTERCRLSVAEIASRLVIPSWVIERRVMDCMALRKSGPVALIQSR
jgi:hypothetical protein